MKRGKRLPDEPENNEKVIRTRRPTATIVVAVHATADSPDGTIRTLQIMESDNAVSFYHADRKHPL